MTSNTVSFYGCRFTKGRLPATLLERLARGDKHTQASAGDELQVGEVKHDVLSWCEQSQTGSENWDRQQDEGLAFGSEAWRR